MGIMAKYKPNIEIVTDLGALSRRCAELFIADAQKAIKANGVFRVAISGGNTPKHFFQILPELSGSKKLSWAKIELFWVDERYVPYNSERSNYKLAFDAFISKVDIPAENVHRIPTEHDDFKTAAQKYENIMRDVFEIGQDQVPEFDLIILGMGVEGHTGSLFPNSYASLNTSDLTCVVYVMDEQLNRITMTCPVLCAAKHLAVLVSGEEKSPILKKVLTSDPDEVLYPIHCLWRVLDRVSWVVDKKAAKLL